MIDAASDAEASIGGHRAAQSDGGTRTPRGRKTALFENLRTTFKDTVALATAIDCKDKYTKGHSVRVGKYMENIAAELG